MDITTIAQLDAAVDMMVSSISNRHTTTVVYLSGDLGSGKTTLAQHLLRRFGVSEAITSPTYTIINEYEGVCGLCIHADLYRIDDPEELLYLDVREWRDRAALILIEWPERGEQLIPEPDMLCALSLSGDRRELVWQIIAETNALQDDTND